MRHSLTVKRALNSLPRAKAAALLLALLAACGHKGPLYLPDEQPPAAPASGEENDQEEDAS